MSHAVNVSFFATLEDQKALLDFLFLETDVRVFESYSEFDSELREFHASQEIANIFSLGYDLYGHGNAILLQLWSPSIMNKPDIEKFSLNPEKCDGHTFRHKINGAGLMQLYFGGIHENKITQSHFGCQSHARAIKWGVEQDVNWESLKIIANKIRYHLNNRLAKEKISIHKSSAVILNQASHLKSLGFEFKWFNQEVLNA